MADIVQESISIIPPASNGTPETPKPASVDAEESANQMQARTALSKARLRELAKKNPPLPKWFDEEEEAPF